MRVPEYSGNLEIDDERKPHRQTKGSALTTRTMCLLIATGRISHRLRST